MRNRRHTDVREGTQDHVASPQVVDPPADPAVRLARTRRCAAACVRHFLPPQRFASEGTVEAGVGIVALTDLHQAGTGQGRRADGAIRPAHRQQHQHQGLPRRPRRSLTRQTSLPFLVRKLKTDVHSLAPEDCRQVSPTTLKPIPLRSPDHSWCATLTEVPASQVPRIAPDFLEEERRSLGDSWFRQEYCCSFEALEGLVYADFARCVVTIPPPRPSGERGRG